MNDCNIIVITPNLLIKQININDTNIDIDNFDIDDITPFINNNITDSRGIGFIQRECDFETLDYSISVFGWCEGRLEDINPYTFIYPLDCVQFFGNIYVILWNKNGIINFTLDAYNDFIVNFTDVS